MVAILGIRVSGVQELHMLMILPELIFAVFVVIGALSREQPRSQYRQYRRPIHTQRRGMKGV